MLNRIATTLIMGLGLSQLIGCQDVVEHKPAGVHNASIVGCTAESQPEDGALGALSCEFGLSVHDAGASLKDELRQALGSYAYALQAGDAATIEKLLSAELRARIDERGSGADFASKLRGFMHREQRKLARSIGTLTASRAFLTVTSAEMLADGSIAALEVAANGKPLPKPFYFVQEDGGYKLDLIQPDHGVASTISAESDGCWDWCTARCDRDYSTCADDCIRSWGHHDGMAYLQCMSSCDSSWNSCTSNCFFLCE